jgi:hypothetical protein
MIQMSDAPAPQPLRIRELYAPSHFGNTYEATLPREMSALLAEARFWGFNRFSDWFDTIDLYNVYARRHRLFNMPEAVWARKFANFECAARQGLGLGLLVTPNHVFADQVTPANEAQKNERMFGQLVCPAQPGATAMILDNYRRLFEDFTARGLRLESLAGAPYDYGGCDCDACRPWIVAFGRLFADIVGVGREYFPALQATLCGWWWSDEEHVALARWAAEAAPDTFQALASHIPYGAVRYAERPVPANCASMAFMHIAYGERSNRDSYNHYGVNLAPRRIEETVRFLAAHGDAGFMAYSEGDHDDVNKALAAGLGSGRFASADAVLRAYAERHFSCDPAGWSELLYAMGDFESLDTVRCRKLFDRLAAQARDSWRLRQIEGRLKMAEADRAVRSRSVWDAQRMADAEAFMAAKETLYRSVWRLGLQRHAFRFESNLPDWHADYARQTGANHAESIMDRLKEA